MKQWLSDRVEFMDSIFAQRPEMYVDGELLGTAPGAIVSAGQPIELTSPEIPFYDDTILVNGTPGEATGTYFVPGDDTLGTSWTEIGFDDASWQVGSLGYGYARCPVFRT